MFDDDRLEAKYINTAETPLYKKSQVLFGLDLAKRDISRQRKAVVVEGYTDVMAMHLAGVSTAVASCGTAFGDEHISVLRRYLLDSEVIRGEVIYTFDGDSAGQKAAIKAFDSDQKFAAHTYVAVAPAGMDPCELRQAKGDEAVKALVESRTPLFAFAIQTTLKEYNLDTAEGQVAATAATIPLVARIKESTLRNDTSGNWPAGWAPNWTPSGSGSGNSRPPRHGRPSAQRPRRRPGRTAAPALRCRECGDQRQHGRAPRSAPATARTTAPDDRRPMTGVPMTGGRVLDRNGPPRGRWARCPERPRPA